MVGDGLFGDRNLYAWLRAGVWVQPPSDGLIEGWIVAIVDPIYYEVLFTPGHESIVGSFQY